MIALALLAGCSTPKPKPTPEKPKETITVPVASGKIAVTARDKDGLVTWVIRAKESSGEIMGEHSSLTLTGVDGEIYMDGKIASTFTADMAEANQATRSLDLKGRVSMVSVPNDKSPKIPKEPLTLTADQAKWLDNRKVIAAQGSVWVRSSVYQMGEFAELWATQDLNKIGTPDRFAP